jgi:hypothetical protein
VWAWVGGRFGLDDPSRSGRPLTPALSPLLVDAALYVV